MELFSRLPISFKLSLILIFPLLGMLYFSQLAISREYAVFKEVEAIEQLSELALACSELVHELQKEVGLSTYFVSLPPDERLDKERLKERLNKQHLITDAAVLKYGEIISGIETQAYGEDFEAAVGWAQGRLSEMSVLRKEVEKRSYQALAKKRRVRTVINKYSYVSDILLDVISATARQSTHAQISSISSAYVNFLHSKQQAALKLALLNAVFTTKTFERGLYPKLIEILHEEKTYQKVFFTFAEETQLKTLQQAIYGEFNELINEMTNVALLHATAGRQISDSVEVEHWFKSMSGQLGLFKDVEDILKTELGARVHELRLKTRHALSISVLIVVGTVGLASTLSVLSIRQIYIQLSMLHSTLNQTANDSDLTRRFKVVSKDEVGQIAIDMNHLLDRLIDMVRHIDRASLRLIVAANNSAYYSNKISENTMQGYVETELTELMIAEARNTDFASVTSSTESSELIKSFNERINNFQSSIDKIEQLHKNTTENSIALEAYSHELRDMSLQLQELVKGFHV